MGSVAALSAHAVRTRLRSAGAVALAVVGALAIGALALRAARDPTAASVAVGNALLATLVAAALVAAATGGVLPEDRASGRAEWLSTLRPAGAQHRLAVAAGGGFLALLAAVAGAALIAVLFALAGRSVPTTHARAVAVERVPGDAVAVVDLPAAPEPRVVELDLQPLVVDLRHDLPPAGRVRLLWQGAAGGAASAEVPLRGSARVAAPSGATRLRVEAEPAGAVPRVVAARLLGAPASFSGNLLLAGLLVGLAAALTAPFAVLLSRGTSAPTAALGAAVATLVGVLREPLLGFASDVGAAGSTTFSGAAAAVVRAATTLAPDLSAVRAVEEVAFGRAIPLDALSRLLPAALHASVCALLLLVPSFRRPAR